MACHSPMCQALSRPATASTRRCARPARFWEFAAEDWSDLEGKEFPQPRTIDDLRGDLRFQEAATDAVIAAVPFRAKAEAAE